MTVRKRKNSVMVEEQAPGGGGRKLGSWSMPHTRGLEEGGAKGYGGGAAWCGEGAGLVGWPRGPVII